MTRRRIHSTRWGLGIGSWRRYVTIVSAVAVAAAAMLASTPGPAQANPVRVRVHAHTHSAQGDGDPCSWTVSGVPAQYRIGLDHPTVHVGGDCTDSDNWFFWANAHWASTNQYVPGNEEDFSGCSYYWFDEPDDECLWMDGTGEFDEVDSAPFNINHAGRMFVHYYDGFAEDWPDDLYSDSLTPTYFTSKYATETSDTPSRNGSKVSFTITPRHWSVGYHAFVHSYDAQVVVEKYTKGNWVPLKTLKPSSTTGNATWSLTSSTRYHYRAVTTGTSIDWGSASSSKLG
jgi:hypothetical protein